MHLGCEHFTPDTVRLEPDEMAAFPNADAVNEALRYLIEVVK